MKHALNKINKKRRIQSQGSEILTLCIMLRADLADRQRPEEREAVNHVDILGDGVQAEGRARAKALDLACSRNSQEASAAGVKLVLLHRCCCFKKSNRKSD